MQENPTVFELTVTLKSEERKYIQKFLIYDQISVNQKDPLILDCINEAKKSFIGEPEEIKIRINMEII